MFRRFRLLCALTLGLLISTTMPASGSTDEPPSQALRDDAATYAQLFDVDQEEALRRLQLQNEVGLLDAELSDEEAEDFAGLWIEHEPTFRVVTRFRAPGAAEERLQERLQGSELAFIVEVRPAQRSLAALEHQFAAARHVVEQLGFRADTAIDVFENRVVVRTPDARGLETALAAGAVQLPAGVVIVEVEELPRPEQAVLVGGTPGSTCTGGFTVERFNGDLGISTAAHCGNSQTFMGESLPFRSEDQEGNQDVQWHSACDILDVTNEFDSGIGLRACIGTRSRDQQAIGSLVCKNGMTTGRTCGIIEHKSYAPWWVTNAASTFVYVDGDQVGENLSEGGDSGSPWFVEDNAYGIHSGGGGNDSIYMPINYISSLGVSVLTHDPGPGCNLAPEASFTYTVDGFRVDFDASGSHDPDGSIVSYHWNFGDGSSTTTTSPTVSHFYSEGEGYFVQLTVTDNEGATGFAGRSVFISEGCDGSRICEAS